MTGSTVTMNGSTNKGGIAKSKKFSFKPVDPEDVKKNGMAAYRAPSLLQPHRVCTLALASIHKASRHMNAIKFLG
jgi:hypothetical protein